MLKSYKYRLYPSKEQSVLLDKHIGSCRFIYNLALECKEMAYSGLKTKVSCFELIKQLPELKKELTWLKEINSQSLQSHIRNLESAFNNFFSKKSDFPKFKKKSNRGSFNIPQSVELKGNKLVIPKFKKGIEIVLHRPIKGTIRQATITKTPTGKYFVSILCETGEQNKPKTKIKESTTVGIDLGIKTFLVSSNGECFDNPKFLRNSLSKLKYLQRKFSKYKGKRTKNKLAKLHEKVANQRKDFLHKTSTKLISENQTICVENLNVKGMMANHKLAQSISDCGWGMFVNMLEYKSEWYGVNLLKIGQFEPSSKMCSCCGSINKELTIKHREWTCSKCGTLLDRDVNASVNIKNFALRKTLYGVYKENHNELPEYSGVITYEAFNKVTHAR